MLISSYCKGTEEWGCKSDFPDARCHPTQMSLSCVTFGGVT